MHPTIALAIGLTAPILDAAQQAWRSVGLFLNIARTPHEAAELLRHGDFDLVLLGSKLSFESRRLLTSTVHDVRSSIPVVYVSADHPASEDGADAIVPDDPEIMLAEIERLLGDRPAMESEIRLRRASPRVSTPFS